MHEARKKTKVVPRAELGGGREKVVVVPAILTDKVGVAKGERIFALLAPSPLYLGKIAIYLEEEAAEVEVKIHSTQAGSPVTTYPRIELKQGLNDIPGGFRAEVGDRVEATLLSDAAINLWYSIQYKVSQNG